MKLPLMAMSVQNWATDLKEKSGVPRNEAIRSFNSNRDYACCWLWNRHPEESNKGHISNIPLIMYDISSTKSATELDMLERPLCPVSLAVLNVS
jgi:hypothetical protein